MPQPGFSVITVRSPVHQSIKEYYAANKETLNARGINSMAGLVSMMFTFWQDHHE